MSDAHRPHNPRARFALLKVLYLAAVTTAVFCVPAFILTRPAQWYVVTGLLFVQVFTLLGKKISAIEVMGPVWRLKWIFLFLGVAYAFLPPETPDSVPPLLLPLRIPVVGWTPSLNLTGLAQAGLMCVQILTVLLATSVVRLTGKSTDLVEGLQALRLPRLFIYSLDHALELLGVVRRGPGSKRGGGGGREGDNAGPAGFFSVLRRVVKGDFSAFTESIQSNLDLAAAKTGREDPRGDARFAHDVAVVTGVALCMSSIKMLKFLPGVPLASGHKTLALFPLYVLASRLTHSRWGGTSAGSIMGLIGLLQGDGRFGILETLKHVAPGVVIDLTEPLVRRWPSWALGYCFVGLLAGIARSATELLVIFALGARGEIYFFVAARLVPNLVFGFLSGFVTSFVMRALPLSNLSGNKPPAAGQRHTDGSVDAS